MYISLDIKPWTCLGTILEKSDVPLPRANVSVTKMTKTPMTYWIGAWEPEEDDNGLWIFLTTRDALQTSCMHTCFASPKCKPSNQPRESNHLHDKTHEYHPSARKHSTCEKQYLQLLLYTFQRVEPPSNLSGTTLLMQDAMRAMTAVYKWRG